MRDRLTKQERELVENLKQDVVPEVVFFDRDYLEQSDNIDLWMLRYFPRDFQSMERLNYEFFSFLEDERRGVAWLPGGSGKSTCLKRWMIRLICVEPQISIIYVEKTLPIAVRGVTAIMQILENNKSLIHDYGDFVGPMWAGANLVIKQRPELCDYPTLSAYGPGGGSALGQRCNVIIIDDPVTGDNSGSELERSRLLAWFNEAAYTCPYPLPLSKPENSKYLSKVFLVGTTFHQDDLFHRVLESGDFAHLHLRAVDEATGETLTPRFSYRDPAELAESEDEADKELLRKIKDGRVIDLFSFRKNRGTVAFYKRYQNEIIGQAQKFSPAWFEPGGKDDYAPPGGYVGCKDMTLSLGAYKEGMRCVTGVDPAASHKNTGNARFASITLGFMPDDPQTIYLLDLDYGQGIPLDSDNDAKRTQVGIALDHVQAYRSRICLETNNIQGSYAGVLRRIAKGRGIIVPITGHYSSLEKKIDPLLGIEAMCPAFENGSVRIPDKTAQDKRKCRELIEELIFWPLGQSDDLVMAFWFAWRLLERMKRSSRAKPAQSRVIPAYMHRGDEWNFPPAWTEQQIEAFLAGGKREEEEDEEVVNA